MDICYSISIFNIKTSKLFSQYQIQVQYLIKCLTISRFKTQHWNLTNQVWKSISKVKCWLFKIQFQAQDHLVVLFNIQFQENCQEYWQIAISMSISTNLAHLCLVVNVTLSNYMSMFSVVTRDALNVLDIY